MLLPRKKEGLTPTLLLRRSSTIFDGMTYFQSVIFLSLFMMSPSTCSILQALVSIGWAFERLARPVPWIRQEIQALELRQALYHQQNYSNPADAFAYLNSSNDYGLNSSSDGQLSSEDINRLLNEMGAEEDEGNFGDFGTSPMGAGTRVPFDQLRGVKGPESEEALTLRMLSSLLG